MFIKILQLAYPIICQKNVRCIVRGGNKLTPSHLHLENRIVQCCETFRFYRSDLFSAAMTSNFFERAINRETQKARGALYRDEEETG